MHACCYGYSVNPVTDSYTCLRLGHCCCMHACCLLRPGASALPCPALIKDFRQLPEPVLICPDIIAVSQG
jgi:hypothetical protein